MPLPPPPETALSAIGKPISSAIFAASSAVGIGSMVPGTTGTPAACITLRAEVLLPSARIAEGGGPTKTSPASAHACAKSGFSARKP